MKVLWVMLILLASCGHRTTPKPLETGGGEAGLPGITQAERYFQGPELRIDWPSPALGLEHELLLFKVYFSRLDSGCSACKPVRDRWLSISSEGELLDSKGFDQEPVISTWIDHPESADDRVQSYSLQLPPKSLDFLQRWFFWIDYQTKIGQVSAPGLTYNIHQPLTVPPPKVLSSWWREIPGPKLPPDAAPAQQTKEEENPDDLSEEPEGPDLLLKLSWLPLVERNYQEIDVNGGVTVKTDRYGLMLFTSLRGLEGPVQQTGMITGEGTFTLKKMDLWARFQDHFGNLSEPVRLSPQGP